MKICPTCNKEYLDDQQWCPYCERRVSQELGADETRPHESGESMEWPDGRPRINPWLIGGVASGASLVGLVLYVGLHAFFAATMINPSVSAAERQGCYHNLAVIERAVMVEYATTDVPITDLEALVPVQLERIPSCPADGIYSCDLTDPALPQATCSLHGSRAAPLE